MGFAIIIIIVVVIIGVVVGMNASKKQKELINDGKIIKRDINFVETAETFTLRRVEFSEVLDTITKAGTGAAVKYNEENGLIRFEGSSWIANLRRQEETEEQCKYRFSFASWKTHNGIPQDTTPMNVTLTAVEKMFLSFDGNTKVDSERIKVKSNTKTSFF